ncbi:MAG: bacillithiol biosynthesis cysteine-adding enzyme BshC [Crocinitomicaceae bacterium]|nr:bacillithiol biosynthesis cysteine-adding enzyme BshC [Crocinitomicaceae bacterium]
MRINRKESGLFSEQQIKMVYEQDFYSDFINEPFAIEAFENQMNLKQESFSNDSRKLLQKALLAQNSESKLCDASQANLNSLSDENTFTITTGHQLSLFTGPLFFVVKILHVIKMCNELQAKHPNKKFIPVYWMATEDHDFEEIQSCNLFNQKITWESDQKGPVGRFDVDDFEEVREKLNGLFSNHEDSEMSKVLASYKGKNFAEMTRNLVNEIFGDKGLIIIDGDDSALKESFVPVMIKEIEEQFSFNAVSVADKELETKGAKLQVTSREINLFYIEKGIRQRVELIDGKFIVQGVGEYSQYSIIEEIKNNPKRFSPNVILRPVYQEWILPNLAYVGGAGEISYWLQLKGIFDTLQLPYPLIQVRNSIVWLDTAVMGKLEKFDFSVTDIFKDIDAWKKEYVQNNAGDELDFTNLDKQLKSLTDELKKIILGVDQSKEQFADAEITKLAKQVEGVKSKAVKMSKGKHEQVMKSMDQIKSKVFPNNGLQERSVNFFQFCADGKVSPHINDLYNTLDPFEKDLIILLAY